jgi:hypothetical protein
VYVDNDDPQLSQYQALLDVTVGPRQGYEGLHHYVNLLAEKSTGDWLFLWNDDAVMQTKNWQKYIDPFDYTTPQVLNPHEPIHNYFPLVSRAFYEALGHFSLSPNNDSYVAEIARALGIEYDIPEIKIRHLRGTLNDNTERNSLAVAPMMSPVHQEFRKKIIPEGVEKVRRAL